MRTLPVKMPVKSHKRSTLNIIKGGVSLDIKEYLRPKSLEEAFEIMEGKGGVIIGGGGFIRLQDREIDAAVDISGLDLSYIKEKDGYIEIGAMTALGKIENSGILQKAFDGIISKTAAAIMGVQVRNMVTIGGSVYGRYGFSDILTTLLALDTSVELYKHKRLTLKEFIESKIAGDILTKIIIKMDDRRGVYSNMRNTSTDFSILNAAVTKTGSSFRIAVGARPGAAKLAKDAMEFISNNEINEKNALKAGEMAAEELGFGSDLRGSAEYRKELCKVLVKRGILGVI